MICPVCGDHFSVRKVREFLEMENGVDYDDLPERMCYDCALAYIQENSVTLFEGSDYDPDDPDSW